MSNLDSKINCLLTGQSLVISTFNNTVCSAERTGDGKSLRFVRTFANGSFEVYKTVDFYFV
jgi:hypothetical protein